MIEIVFHIITTLAQFIFILWPLFIVTAFAYSFQGTGGKRWLKTLGTRIHRNLLITWLVLFFVWGFTFFSNRPTPSLLPEPFNSVVFLAGLITVTTIEINRLRLFPLRILAKLDMHDAKAIESLRQMNPAHFEELVAETYRSLGYKATRKGKSGDHGIDVEVITQSGELWIVQCKRYREPVGENIVRELYGTMAHEKANRAVLVTSAEITPPAEAWAKGKPIDLIDGWQFLKMMERARNTTHGSLFDQFVYWLAAFRPQPSVSSTLRQNLNGSSRGKLTEQTRPTRVRSHLAVTTPIRAFNCPRCGGQLVAHPRHPERGLYRCSNYPECKVVIDQNVKTLS